MKKQDSKNKKPREARIKEQETKRNRIQRTKNQHKQDSKNKKPGEKEMNNRNQEKQDLKNKKPGEKEINSKKPRETGFKEQETRINRIQRTRNQKKTGFKLNKKPE